MRIFVAFEDVRLPMDVQPGQTIGDVKAVLKDHFKLNSSHAEGKILRMMYAGAILRDDWICSDVGITSTSTIKSILIDSDQPVLHIECPYNGRTIVIRDQLNFSSTSVNQLQKLASSKTGLPVSVFRLYTQDGRQMFGCHTLERYGIDLGSTILLHVWDGWADLLKAATQGHTKKVFRNASTNNDQVAKFQYRVACFIAAHFGYVDLANSMIKPNMGSVKPEEPVGQHPSRLWTKNSCHIDAWKTPVHEAVACGKVNVLRIFVQHNICSLISKDGEGRTPMQTAFRYKQLECVQYLTSKLYSSYTENNITLPVLIVIKTKKWSEKAREEVLAKQGSYKSSMRRRPYQPQALVGHGILVDGFSHSAMNSRSALYDPFRVLGGEANPDFQNKARLLDVQLDKSRVPGSAVRPRQFKISESSDASKLPGLSQQGSKMPESSDYRAETGSGSYIQTPKLENNRLPAIQEGKSRKILRLKTRVEGSIPLPALSVENHLRPFFHTTSKSENPVLATLKLFDTYRQMSSRENAIQCMTMASTFKDKAWLRQVDLAVSLACRGVTNTIFEPVDQVTTKKSLPTIAASPVKTRE